MDFKVGDKVKVISLSNTFSFNSAGLVSLLNKTFTVCHTYTIHDLIHDIKKYYVTVEENTYHWNEKDLILVNNSLEIE